MLTFRRSTLKSSPPETSYRSSNSSRSSSVSPSVSTVSKGTSRKRTVTTEERHKMIEREAYFIAERRGFCGGDPVRDWLEAENKVDHYLSTTH